MSATEAIVQFIGIVMLTAGVPNDPGVHAIVPRIEGSGLQTERRAYSLPHLGHGTEKHTAVILYEQSARIGPPTWTPTTFQTSWEYVVLDGERIQFVTSAVNGAASVPRDLPHACPTMTLQSKFQGPDYMGAATVVDIPEGSLDVCLAQNADNNGLGRADTRLFLKTSGSFVIVATKPNKPAKTITFHPDATVYIANIPPRYLDPLSPSVAGGTPHYTAYDEMGGTTNCTPKPDTSNICRLCETSAMKTAGKLQSSFPFPLMTNSECSNTQWP